MVLVGQGGLQGQDGPPGGLRRGEHRTTETEATELRRERGRVDRLRLEVKIEQEEGRGSRKRLEECLERCGVLEEQLGRDEVPA